MGTVTLEVISSNRVALGNDWRHTFGRSGGTIGRAWDNDLVLRDPLCHISSKHACIVFEDGSFYLEDVSTNGVVINGNKPLGKGNRVDLSTVERIRVGDYLIGVILCKEPNIADSGRGAGSELEDNFSVENAFHFDLPSVTFDEDLLLEEGRDLNIADEDFSNQARYDMLDVISPPPDPSDHHEGVSRMEDAFSAPISQTKESSNFHFESSRTENNSFIPENWNLTGIHRSEALNILPVSITTAPPIDTTLDPESQPAEAVLDKSSAATVPKNIAQLPAGGLAEAALRKAGIDPRLLDNSEFIDQWVAMLPLVFGGLVELLQARATIKNEIRASKTMLQPVENNPLKFSVNAADAIQNVFITRRGGFLPADQAVAEAISDLKIHQIALINGIQGGINALINKLSPQAIESLAAQSPIQKNLFGKVSKSSLWEAYKFTFSDMIDHSTDSFLDVFADDFVEAYEKHITMAKKVKK